MFGKVICEKWWTNDIDLFYIKQTVHSQRFLRHWASWWLYTAAVSASFQFTGDESSPVGKHVIYVAASLIDKYLTQL